MGPPARRKLAVVALLLIAILLPLIWGFVTCGAAILYNYAWWISFAGSVQLATPSTAAQVTAAHGGSPEQLPVPKILHQTWKDDTIPERWQAASQSCKDLHPDWDYQLWTDERALDLIRTKFPWFLNTYLNYPHPIQRADALRYFVLYEYGGIYLDLDIQCLKRLDFLRAFNFTAPKTYPIGVSNDFMASAPGDPFAYRLITNLRGWQHRFLFKYATVMFSTGPMFVTVQYTLHDKKQGVAVLPADLYGKYKGNQRLHEQHLHQGGQAPGPGPALMEHLHGSSWHGGDAGFIFFMNTYGLKLALAFAVGLPLAITVWWLWSGKGSRDRCIGSENGCGGKGSADKGFHGGFGSRGMLSLIGLGDAQADIKRVRSDKKIAEP